jgi:formylglycine-generating enzyme
MTYWPAEVAHRAPVNDFPPTWASAWGDDRYGLWADLVVGGEEQTSTQRMRWIEPTLGEGFWLGSTAKERSAVVHEVAREHLAAEADPQEVAIKSGFWLADTPCTQDFFQTVTGHNPSHYETADSGQLPVEWIPLQSAEKDGADVQQFIDLLSQRLPKGVARLPREEEWEYAARADQGSLAYWWGARFNNALATANVDGKKSRESPRGTTEVKSLPPNPWGLYAMHGNVWEWTASSWKPQFHSPAGTMDSRRSVVRGGSWLDHPDWCRSASRMGVDREHQNHNLGFRFAISTPRN